MHGSLSRKLRIFGFDVLYPKKAGDEALLKMAAEENRVLITSDEVLHRVALKKGLGAVLLRENDDLGRMVTVFRKLGLRPELLRLEASRCSVCNGSLEVVKKEGLVNLLPGNILERHRIFYRCISCRKIFWEGNHWGRIRVFAENVGRRMVESS